MTIETDLFTRLSTFPGLVGTGIYPMVLPVNTTFPAATYQRISGIREQAHDGDSGLQHGRWQFSCWGLTYASALAVAEQVRLALQGITLPGGGGGYFENMTDLYEPAEGWYQIAVDMTIWHS